MSDNRIDIASVGKFDGKNYHQWKFQLYCALRAKGIYEIVKGTETKPSEDGDPQKKWIKDDAYAMFLLTSAMDYSQITLIENCQSSKQIINKLDAIYEQKTEMNKMIAHERFSQYKMDVNDSIAQHIAKVENLAQQIRDTGEDLSDIAIMTKILGSLPPKFRSFRQAWLSLDETRQTIQNLTSRLLDEDASLTASDNSEIALATSSNVDKKAREENKQRPKLDKSKITCYKCQKKGHFAKECYGERKSRNTRQDTQHKSHQNSQQGNYSAFIHENNTQFNLNDETWILDSGATSHMTYRRDFLFDFEASNDNTVVVLGNGQELSIKGKGNVKIKKLVKGRWFDATIADVLYVPNLNKNLFSEGVIAKKGMKIVKENIYANIFENNVFIASAICKENNLYHMQFRTVMAYEANVIEKDSLRRWHERLGHLNVKSIKEMVSKDLIKGIELSNVEKFFCESCVYGKQHKLSFTSSKRTKAKLGELIYSDLCGPMSVSSVQGAKYFVSFKDDYSGYRVVFFIKNKSDTLGCFKEFNRLLKNKFGNFAKILHVDNGGEYCNEDFKTYLSQCGIELETTAPYTPEQNGRAERDMRTIVESARSMLYAKDVPLNLWAEAVNTAVYILNRTATTQAPNTTPYELWTEKKPVLNHIKTFGCEAFMHITKEQRNKLAAKGKKLMLVGYDKNSTNYRLYDIETKKIKVSRNVLFNEDIAVPEERKNIARIILEDDTSVMQPQQPRNNSNCNDVPQEKTVLEDQEKQQDVIEKNNPVENYNLRSRETIKRPERYEAHYTDIKIPECYEEAINSNEKKEWCEAIQEEINALSANKTWDERPLPEDKETIGSRWVFNIKTHKNGEISRFKARLCAKGFTQKKGIDYNDTFSPTVRYDSIRILLAIAVQQEYEIMQFDVKTAFLNGKLEEEVYMLPPEGVKVKPGMVCKLNRALYGLKQASRCWNQRFDNFLKGIGFAQSDADKCVYQGTFNNSKILLALYVDDGLIMGKDMNGLQHILSQLKESFEITVCDAQCFVGMEIKYDRDKGSIFINQENYIKRVIKKFNMDDAKTVSTPAELHIHLSSPADGETKVNVPYREAVGNLMFAAIVTRPDIAFAVGVVSRYLDKYDKNHWSAVKRIIRYLKETENYGIMYTKTGGPNIVQGYSDSDFASDIVTRRSTTGYLFKLSNGPITWSSQRQSAVSLSTTEAEYIAASCAAREAVWIHQLLQDIEEPLETSIPLFVDNQSAIKLIHNAEFHKRTKHVDIRYHHIREKLASGIIDILYVCSESQLADILTKAIPRDQFLSLRIQIGITSV